MKQVVIKNLVPKPVRPGDCLLSRMFSSRPDGGLSLRGVTTQEDLVQYLQRMFSLPDLPVCNAPPFVQVSQKGFKRIR